MAQDERETLELLRFELKFVEDGGYGRSPRTPWRPPYILEDSPSCPNLGDPVRPHPCNECRLIKFVPSELRSENSPCRFIPLNEKGQTIDYFYRSGTQLKMEEALTGWLRSEITRIEQQREPGADQLPDERDGRLRLKMWDPDRSANLGTGEMRVASPVSVRI
jgi:hypothetical protein